jgi:lipid-A-disaccharide synthase-like uncharacterized protein
MSINKIWLGIGFLGQFLFSMRFIVQWIVSERRKESVIPIYFWYFSLAGGITLLSYAIYRKDPVFILGQLFGVFIYIRNLMFIHRDKYKKKEGA